MKEHKINIPTNQLTWLVILRIAIGWHFLFEGWVKLVNGNWSSMGYLMDSKGIFSKMFFSMATHPGILSVVDFLNEWGLLLIGLGLILGAFTKIATYGGMLMLLMYYLSHPPLIGVNYALPSEGSYLFVNKTFIEFCAMGVLLVFPTGCYFGLDRLFTKRKTATV